MLYRLVTNEEKFWSNQDSVLLTDVENAIDRTYDKWGILKGNMKFKETVVRTQKQTAKLGAQNEKIRLDVCDTIDWALMCSIDNSKDCDTYCGFLMLIIANILLYETFLVLYCFFFLPCFHFIVFVDDVLNLNSLNKNCDAFIEIYNNKKKRNWQLLKPIICKTPVKSWRINQLKCLLWSNDRLVKIDFLKSVKITRIEKLQTKICAMMFFWLLHQCLLSELDKWFYMVVT